MWPDHGHYLMNKKAQLSPVKRRYSQSIQFLLQYWPSRSPKVDDFYLIWKSVRHFLLVTNSNLGPISYRFQDMASFPLKNAHFPTSFHSAPNFKMFPLNCIPQILYAESLDSGLIIPLKVFPYDRTLSHNTSVTDTNTDRRQSCHKRLQHVARQKSCYAQNNQVLSVIK